EDIFLRVVGQAQREKLETSGAESAEGVSSFLAGDPDRKEGLVDSLISAGRREKERAPVTTAPVENLPTARADVLSKLVSEGADAADSSEPVESPVSTPKPDAEVIDRLLNPDDPSASADNPASGPLK
ncbi:MAG: hypothetical protein O7B26_11150, partial [Planctomycetota bacterium]|nr:hypothetical protein [Planctomycetota bacterium]